MVGLEEAEARGAGSQEAAADLEVGEKGGEVMRADDLVEASTVECLAEADLVVGAKGAGLAAAATAAATAVEAMGEVGWVEAERAPRSGEGTFHASKSRVDGMAARWQSVDLYHPRCRQSALQTTTVWSHPPQKQT